MDHNAIGIIDNINPLIASVCSCFAVESSDKPSDVPICTSADIVPINATHTVARNPRVSSTTPTWLECNTSDNGIKNPPRADVMLPRITDNFAGFI